MKKLSIVGIDIAKQVFHLVGMDEHGTILVRKRLYRAQVMAFIAQLPPTRIGMEACGGAHDWARRFREHGHEVKLMAPQFVKPYVKANKNDMRDAEAIAEAVTRPTMRFVPTKERRLNKISKRCHRVRERLMGERTALVNEVHGLLHEYGMVMPKGVTKFRHTVVEKLESEQDKLTPLSQEMFWKLVRGVCGPGRADLPITKRSSTALATTHARVSASDDDPGDWALEVRRPCWPPSAMPARSRTAASLPRGWGWCHANIPLAGRRACWASANVATAICANSSSTGHG